MFTEDYHVHTEMSFDSNAKLSDICCRAIGVGINEIAITEHYDIGVTEIEEGNNFDVNKMKENFEQNKIKYKDKLNIRFGIELAQPHFDVNKTKEVLKRADFDFVLCSLHTDREGKDYYYMNFENVDINKVFDDYLTDLENMIEFKDFDILGHITYPLRYALKVINKFEINNHRMHLESFLKKVIKMGKGIEVNLSTLRDGQSDPMPDYNTIKLYKELGGEIISVGTDSHFARHVGAGVHDAINELKYLGFKYIATFENRKLKMKKII